MKSCTTHRHSVGIHVHVVGTLGDRRVSQLFALDNDMMSGIYSAECGFRRLIMPAQLYFRGEFYKYFIECVRFVRSFGIDHFPFTRCQTLSSGNFPGRWWKALRAVNRTKNHLIHKAILPLKFNEVKSLQKIHWLSLTILSPDVTDHKTTNRKKAKK